jgi:hypothetical protein
MVADYRNRRRVVAKRAWYLFYSRSAHVRAPAHAKIGTTATSNVSCPQVIHPAVSKALHTKAAIRQRLATSVSGKLANLWINCSDRVLL